MPFRVQPVRLAVQLAGPTTCEMADRPYLAISSALFAFIQLDAPLDMCRYVRLSQGLIPERGGRIHQRLTPEMSTNGTSINPKPRIRLRGSL